MTQCYGLHVLGDWAKDLFRPNHLVVAHNHLTPANKSMYPKNMGLSCHKLKCMHSQSEICRKVCNSLLETI